MYLHYSESERKMAMTGSPGPKTNAVVLIIGGAVSGLLAGIISTLIFLWIYGFDTYRVAFYNRTLPVLSVDFKYIFLGLCTLIWFVVFMKWVFKRPQPLF
jgi:hypothetical protein